MNVVTTPVPAIKAWQAALETQAQFDATSRPSREKAFAQFLELGLPTPKFDAWKYTDLRRLSLRQFHLPDQATNERNAIDVLPSFRTSHRLVFIDGLFNSAISSIEPRPGITTTTFKNSSPMQPQGMNLKERATQSAFDLLNAALLTDGVLIEIDANAVIAEPISLAFVWTAAASSTMSHPRIDIRVARGARLELVEHHIGLSEAANFTNAMIHINVGEGANVLHTRIQEDAPANFLIENLNVNVAGNARYINHHYVLSSGLSRCEIELQLSGPGAHAELHGLLLAQATQHLDVRTCIEHQVPNTRSIEDYRGIADDRGRVVFNGKVIVRPDAQKTDARQSSKNLLLSPTAEIDTRPELEIYANDVLCAHGATVGQLDDTALFYLQSRGINLEDARAILTHAFAAELLERLPNATVRDYVLAQLMKRLGTRIPRL